MLLLNKRKVLVLTLVLLLISTIILICVITYKPSIHTVTLEELTDIRGIDGTLANRVIIYIKANPDANIDDLDDIYGFGEYRVNLIRKKWGD